LVAGDALGDVGELLPDERHENRPFRLDAVRRVAAVDRDAGGGDDQLVLAGLDRVRVSAEELPALVPAGREVAHVRGAATDPLVHVWVDVRRELELPRRFGVRLRFALEDCGH
jgi:hypothetical protein